MSSLTTSTREILQRRPMSSGYSIPPFSSYASPDQSLSASHQAWAPPHAAAYGSLTLPPINVAAAAEPFSFRHQGYFDALPRLSSPDLFLQEPSALPSREEEPPPSNQEAIRSLPAPVSQYRISESPEDLFDEFDFTPPRSLAAVPSQSQNSTRSSSVVDLTVSSPLDMPGNRKRKAGDVGDMRTGKAARTSGRARTSRNGTPTNQESLVGAEVVDLVDVEDDSQYEEFKARQAAELIKQQQQDEATKPMKLAEFQCIICMDNPTDLTVTHCGHLFCSECLHQALYAGNAKKSCPVCRTSINTALVGKGDLRRQPKNGIFALEMKLMTANKKGKHRIGYDDRK